MGLTPREKRPSLRGDADDSLFRLGEAEIVGVLPHGEPGAGGAPSVHDFFVRAVALREPLEEVDDEGFYDGISHYFILRRTRPRDQSSHTIP